MTEIGKATLAVVPDASGFGSKLNRDLDGPFTQAGRDGSRSISRGMNSNSTAFGSFGKKAGGLFAGAFAAVGVASIARSITDFLGDAVGAGSDLNETISKSSQIFGDANAKVLSFSKTAAQALGQSQQTALDGAATFGIFANSAGLSADAAADFSIEMATLATDLASFNNTSPEDAITAIGAALRGEAEPIRAYGVLLDDATLRQRALALGLIATTTDALTPQQRVLAAHSEILAQTATQQGDFARTSEGLANQQRILNAELENTKAEIGTALLPVVTDLFRTFAAEGVPALQDMAKWFSENEESVRGTAVAFAAGALAIGEGFIRMGQLSAWFRLTFDRGLEVAAAAFFFFVTGVVDGAAQAFGWIPGLGPKLREAAAHVDELAARSSAGFASMTASAAETTSMFGAAGDAVRDLRGAVQKLDGAKATVFLNADGNLTRVFGDGSFRQSGSRLTARATGGPVRAGQPYIVGEHEAELFVPDRNGQIYNQSQLAAAGANGGGTVINNNVTADSVLAHRYAQDVANKTHTAWSDAIAVHGVG